MCVNKIDQIDDFNSIQFFPYFGIWFFSFIFSRFVVYPLKKINKFNERSGTKTWTKERKYSLNMQREKKIVVEVEQTIFIPSPDYWTFTFIFQRLNSLYKMKCTIYYDRKSNICLSNVLTILYSIYSIGESIVFYWNHSKCSRKKRQMLSQVNINSNNNNQFIWIVKSLWENSNVELLNIILQSTTT